MTDLRLKIGLFLGLLAVACEALDAGDKTAGETHFLKACSAGDTCGDGLECVCERCTLPCDDQAACSAYPGAECIAVSSSCESEAPVVSCGLECDDDRDCSAISTDLECDEGFCRAAADPTTTDLSESPLACELGTVDAGEVLIIGDNFFAGENHVVPHLETRARATGVLAASEEFRDFSAFTGNALAYMGGGIPEQYAEGNANGDVRFVIMNGGGVDAVFGTCEEADGECPVLVSAANAAQQLLAQMAEDGVEDVLYVFYPEPGKAGQKERIDALRPLIQAVCEEAPLNCFMLDTRPTFEGRYEEYVTPDGLTPEGADATAQAVWALTGVCLAP